jgi:prepilin-type N-terminal cleavage/methylation domain-containing protein
MITATAPRRHAHSATGFTLIEVLLVVAVVGTLASIALPGLMRARGAAAEISAIGSLRAIHAAQTSYATSCAAGFYAPSMSHLLTVQGQSQGNQGKGKGQGKKTDDSPGFIGAEFTGDTTDRGSYRIRLTAGAAVKEAKATCSGVAAGEAVGSFFVSADLLSETNGASRYFGINQNGVMYESSKRIAVFYTGEPPAPARPLR